MSDDFKKYLNAKGDEELISIIADEYKDQGLSMEELIKAGNEGIAKARDKYDEKQGFSFNAYAVWWIRQAILKAIEAKK